MIDWNEEADRYILRVNRWESVFLWALAAVAAAAPPIALEVLSRRVDAEGRFCCLTCFVPLAVLSAVKAVARIRQRGWIEVPLHGGPVRWGSPGRARMVEGVQVKMFAVDDLPGEEASVVAILPDGTPMRVFGRWRSSSTGRVRAVVRQLNDLLSPSAPRPEG